MRTGCECVGLARLTIQKHIFIGSRSVRFLTHVGLLVMMVAAIALTIGAYLMRRKII